MGGKGTVQEKRFHHTVLEYDNAFQCCARHHRLRRGIRSFVGSQRSKLPKGLGHIPPPPASRPFVYHLPPSIRQAGSIYCANRTNQTSSALYSSTAPVVFPDLNLISRRACYLSPFAPHVLARNGQSEHPSSPLRYRGRRGLFVPDFFHARVRPVSYCCRVHIYAPLLS